MKIEYEVKERTDDYSGATEYVVEGYVNGNFFGIIDITNDKLNAHYIGKMFNPDPNDARIKKYRHIKR